MKTFAWIMIVFSSLCIFAALGDSDENTIYGVAYMIAVIIFCGKHLAIIKKEEIDEERKKEPYDRNKLIKDPIWDMRMMERIKEDLAIKAEKIEKKEE